MHTIIEHIGIDIFRERGFSMEIGDQVNVKSDSFSTTFIVLATCEKSFDGTEYEIGHLTDNYTLYVKKGAEISSPLDVKEHRILSEDEIHGGDYYLKVHLIKSKMNKTGIDYNISNTISGNAEE